MAKNEREGQGLEGLPDDARLWIFGVDRPLEDGERSRLLGEVGEFVAQWKAHGARLAAASDFRHGRFLLVGVDERVEAPSGCSIDALVHTLKALEGELGVTLVDSAPVWYREGEEIRRVSRVEFRARAEAGEVTPETLVFDMTATRLGSLRAGEWERPARESWHGRVFFRDVGV